MCRASSSLGVLGSHRRGVDFDICADGDIQRAQVRLFRHLGSVASSAGQTLLHLVVLVRRPRAGHRGSKVGGADVGVDVVGVLGVPAATGELQLGEQAANDGQTGADEANAGLDVGPEGGLVDGVGRVGGVHPEEHDDTVDTGEADEATKGEDTVQGELVLPRTLQTPDHGHRQRQDGKVHEHIEGLVGDDELHAVDAGSLNALVPVGAERAALQRAC